MVLLPLPSPDFSNVSQLKQFAWQNKKNLEMFATSEFADEEIAEIMKYRNFYRELKFVADLVFCDIEDDARELDIKLSKMIKEAARKRDINEKLYRLHDDFLNQKDNLKKIMEFLVKGKQNNKRMDTDEVRSSQQSCEDYKVNKKFKFHAEEIHRSGCNITASDQVEISKIYAGGDENSNAFNCANSRYLDMKKGHQWSIQKKSSDSSKYPVRAENVEVIGAVGGLNNPESLPSVDRENNAYPFSTDQFYGSMKETHQTYSSQFQNILKTEEHSKNKRKNEVKEYNCMKDQIPKSQTHPFETKTMQTKMTDRTARTMMEQDAIDDRASFEYYRISSDGGGQPLKQKAYTANNTANDPGIPKEHIKTDTRALKMDELTQQLSELQASRSKLISRQDILDFGVKEQIDTEKSLMSEGQCRSQNAEQTVEMASNSESYSLVRSSPACGSGRPSSTTRSKLRTLEDSLKFFGLFDRLKQLEKSLEKVRRHRSTVADHEAECKQFDKELQKLAFKYHPDSVLKRGAGSEKEMERAKELQTALNATRTVLNTINKIFLEDIDIDHKYGFFTKLDIASLGNEDEVENHVYDVLFNISLVSEIKQENIIAEIRKFLTAAQDCIESYLENDKNFQKHRGKAFFHLKRCVDGYQKLYTELSEVEEQCRKESLHNIHPLMRSMQSECSEQLRHLEALLELTKFPFGEFFPLYKSSHSSIVIDDYFVLPFVSYINVIMTCSTMIRNTAESNSSGYWHGFKNRVNSFWGKSHCTNVQVSIPEHDAISYLHYLATHYSTINITNKQSKRSMKVPPETEYINKEYVKEEFLARLKAINDNDLKRFKVDDYIEGGTKRHIMKELKICNEMKAEFEMNKKEVSSCLEEISKNTDYMKQRLDELYKNSQKVSDELSECLADSKVFKDKIENYSHKKESNLNEMLFHT